MGTVPAPFVERTSTETYPLEPAWLSDALVFIDRNIAKNLTASDVYCEVGFSHTQVDKVFRLKLGASVQDTIASLRLEHAQHLLATTRMPVMEIAPLCGFSSAQYLIRTFTNRYGLSPVSWRKTITRASQSVED